MLLIFTDLDGTLLNHQDYNYKAAVPILATLSNQKIPVIPVTSKTRQEVETLIKNLELASPFVVENGSGIFIPVDYQKFSVPQGKKYGDYVLLNLGLTYEEARQGLRKLEIALGKELQGFGDLSQKEIQHLTNLPLKDVLAAKAREFTEPFVLPKDVPPEKIAESAREIGLKVLVGGRFCHLMGKSAGKGKAVQFLVHKYSEAYRGERIVTVGLGDSPNDLEMLEVVDKPIIIPNKRGKPHPLLLKRGWTVAANTAPEGWAESIAEILAKDELKS